MTPLINGTAYSFAQVVVNLLNGDINSVAAINYKRTQEKTNNYGAGDEPVSRGKGVKESEADITFSMNDGVALRNSVPSKDLLDIPPFDIVVTYRHPDRVVTDILKNCEFLEDGRELEQGDTDADFNYPLLPSHILYDV